MEQLSLCRNFMAASADKKAIFVEGINDGSIQNSVL